MMWKRSRQHLHDQAPQMMTVETPEDLSSLQGSSTRDGRCWIAESLSKYVINHSHRIDPLSNHQMESCQEIKIKGRNHGKNHSSTADWCPPLLAFNFNHSGKLTNLRRDQRILFFYRVIRSCTQFLHHDMHRRRSIGPFSMEFYKSFILIKWYSLPPFQITIQNYLVSYWLKKKLVRSMIAGVPTLSSRRVSVSRRQGEIDGLDWRWSLKHWKKSPGLGWGTHLGTDAATLPGAGPNPTSYQEPLRQA